MFGDDRLRQAPSWVLIFMIHAPPLAPLGDAASGAVMDPVTLRMHYARLLASRQWTEIALSLCHAGRVGTTDPC